MKTLTIEYYAGLRDAAGHEHETISTSCTSPREVFREISQRHEFGLRESDLKVAVNDEFADWDRELQDGDKLVFIPPVSGGLAMFELSSTPIDAGALRRQQTADSSGGFVCFEGWVRNHNDGRQVNGLHYQAYEALAISEGQRIIAEALEKFAIRSARCQHRIGALDVGGLAVWVGADAAHRDAAFGACRYIIDQVKARVPIWKKERYTDGDATWVDCRDAPTGS